ncbi:PaaI family thioesterase [Undibacterium fentianense]|uniref:PaaI family thioesterase n=1 Tax=Undibacterium fentianense TaxID=2828728 RepID=A0A941E4D1_9BURK|nr:PaaI family thioesterase [Undibacterium fentianense]MBR7800369.1 PaaI family thioesterase [Undibacterium fentianense]
MPLLSKEQIQSFLHTEFPQTTVIVESLNEKGATVRQTINDQHLRPGGTVSGPVLMAVADVAMYVALLGEIGIVPLAVTTNLSINFLRKPAADSDIVAHCQLLKVGKRLAVGEVSLFSEGQADPVAHVVCTYAIPSV